MQSHVFAVRRLRGHLVRVLVAGVTVGPPAVAQAPQPLPPVVVYASGEEAKFTGIIIDRNGDEMRVREGDHALRLVRLTDGTKISTPSGPLKLDRIRRDTSTLIPGLMLTIEGHGGPDGTLIAEKIKFSSRSMRTAQQINVGQEALRGRVAANTDSIERAKERARDSLARVNKRISNLDDYDERLSTVVNFETGSAILGQGAKLVLDDLVKRSAALKGYVIEVTGYADTTGPEPYNRELSARRAESVVAYLTEVHKVPLRRILNPTGHGTAQATATNSTEIGRAMNRRARVRVLVNRTLGNGQPR